MCEYLVKRLRPDTEVVSRTLVNKRKLIADCGETAALLFQDGCNRVVIVWDLYPPWRPQGGKPCRFEDREAVLKSLQQAGVPQQNVHLVCIREELEAWLIADNRAIELAISKLSGRTRPRIAEVQNPDLASKPKARLMKIFRQHTRQYEDHIHAIKIARELETLGLKKIKRCQSFARFALKATDVKL